MQMIIRDACKNDLPAIVQLLADDPLGQTRENITQEVHANYLCAFSQIEGDDNARILVAIENEKILGCLQLNMLANLTFCGMKRGLIEGVRVHKSCRGKGMGKALISEAVEICKTHGCGMVQLTTNVARPEAVQFYQQCGFKPSHIGLKLMLETPNNIETIK